METSSFSQLAAHNDVQTRANPISWDELKANPKLTRFSSHPPLAGRMILLNSARTRFPIWCNRSFMECGQVKRDVWTNNVMYSNSIHVEYGVD